MLLLVAYQCPPSDLAIWCKPRKKTVKFLYKNMKVVEMSVHTCKYNKLVNSQKVEFAFLLRWTLRSRKKGKKYSRNILSGLLSGEWESETEREI